MVVDSRYTEGVWYDMSDGSYCRIEQQRNGAALLDITEGRQYYEWDDNEEASRELERDFRKVPEDAVENPVKYIVEILDGLHRNQVIPEAELRGLGYARERVEIQEK